MHPIINAVIVDDDIHFIKIFKAMLLKLEGIKVKDVFYNGKGFVDAINKGLDYDLAFLDISLPDIKGIDIGKHIKQNANIRLDVVFVTGNTEYAVDAFNIDATDYLVKPFDSERLKRCISKVKDNIKSSQLLSNKHTVYSNDDIIVIDVQDILFIEKYYRFVLYHTLSGIYKSNATLSNIEPMLTTQGFIRSHKSFIINPRHLLKCKPWGDRSYQIIFKHTNKIALLSRNYSSMFIKHIDDMCI